MLRDAVSAGYLAVFLRSVVVGVSRAGDGTVSSLSVVQRAPRPAYDEWSEPLSSTLSDWYSGSPSSRFCKRKLGVTADVFVEATEFGDVLGAAMLRHRLGPESPTEASPSTLPQCTQAATLPFFLTARAAPEHGAAAAAAAATAVSGSPFSLHNFSFAMEWSYRRGALGAQGDPSLHVVNPGDSSQQNWNWGNDYDAAGVLQPATGAAPWAGGVNVTALRGAEQLAAGFAQWLPTAAGAPSGVSFAVNGSLVGTTTGLPKMPYLRESRRAVGLGGFALTVAAINDTSSSECAGDDATASAAQAPGCRFADTVALAGYNLDVHSVAPPKCSLPPYLSSRVFRPCACAARDAPRRGLRPLTRLLARSLHPIPRAHARRRAQPAGGRQEHGAVVLGERGDARAPVRVVVWRRRRCGSRADEQRDDPARRGGHPDHRGAAATGGHAAAGAAGRRAASGVCVRVYSGVCCCATARGGRRGRRRTGEASGL